MRVPLSVGLGLVVGYPVIVVLVSAFGFTNHTVWGVGAIGLMPFLFGAIAWIQPARHRRDFYRLLRQRNALLCCLAFVVAIPLTRWPLWLSLALVGHRMEKLVIEAFREPDSEYDSLDFALARLTGYTMVNKQCGSFLIRTIRIEKGSDGTTAIRYLLTTGMILRLYASPGMRRWEIEEP